MADQLKFSLCMTGQSSHAAPRVRFLHNGCIVHDLELVGEKIWIDFMISPEDDNHVSIDFYNKRPKHTQTDGQGNIVSDMICVLHQVRVDDILLESWFIDDGAYRPRYFQPSTDDPEMIASQRIWHFPGLYQLSAFPHDFWEWYHQRRQLHIHLENMDIDLHRWEKFAGSPELYPELVEEIKALIRGT